MGTGPWEGGKGSRPRKYNVKQYLDNYERIFGLKESAGNAQESVVNESNFLQESVEVQQGTMPDGYRRSTK